MTNTPMPCRKLPACRDRTLLVVVSQRLLPITLKSNSVLGDNRLNAVMPWTHRQVSTESLVEEMLNPANSPCLLPKADKALFGEMRQC